MKIQVYESDCKCSNTYQTFKEIIDESNINCQLEQITDFAEIAINNIMSLPTIVIDGEAVSVGKKLNREQIIKILQK